MIVACLAVEITDNHRGRMREVAALTTLIIWTQTFSMNQSRLSASCGWRNLCFCGKDADWLIDIDGDVRRLEESAALAVPHGRAAPAPGERCEQEPGGRGRCRRAGGPRHEQTPSRRGEHR